MEEGEEQAGQGRFFEIDLDAIQEYSPPTDDDRAGSPLLSSPNSSSGADPIPPSPASPPPKVYGALGNDDSSKANKDDVDKAKALKEQQRTCFLNKQTNKQKKKREREKEMFESV